MTETISPPQTPNDNLPTWAKPTVGITFATIAIIGWAFFVRFSQTDSPVSFENFVDFGFDPYFFGVAAQEIIVPVILLYLFSRTNLFRRFIKGSPSAKDEYQLLFVLSGIQILFFLYRYVLLITIDEAVSFGFLIVLVAGLLGGWRVGFGTGLVTMLAVGAFTYVKWFDGDVIPWAEFFEYGVLKNMEAVTAVWVGAVAGLSQSLLGSRRFEVTAVMLFTLAIEVSTFLLISFSDEDAIFYVNVLISSFVITSIAMLAFLAMVQTVRDDETRREAEAAQLELSDANLSLTQTKLALAQAELRALHAQINPHFFFNTLNTIRYFVRTNPEQARDLLVRLSEIFQRALSAGEFVPLEDEISYVEAYLTLEKARLDERLKIIWTNMAKGLMETAVPTLILQPIVENAIIHGISPQAEGGTLHIIINKLENDLLFQVEDDGAGFDTEAERSPLSSNSLEGRERPSIGLTNVDERLRILFGDGYGLSIESEVGQGTRVIFKIPINK